jgi:hypothetical protein
LPCNYEGDGPGANAMPLPQNGRENSSQCLNWESSHRPELVVRNERARASRSVLADVTP